MDSLKKQLEAAGIDTSTWGQGKAKTVEHLLSEIESGEAALVTGETGELVRAVAVVNANVFYMSHDGEVLKLKELKQAFKDGRERSRRLPGSVSEKMKPDEDPRDAALRGISEELGISGDVTLRATDVNETVQNSFSFPGLQSRYTIYGFDAALTSQQFNPDGYIEEQEDKSTYFVWEAEEHN